VEHRAKKLLYSDFNAKNIMKTPLLPQIISHSVTVLFGVLISGACLWLAPDFPTTVTQTTAWYIVLGLLLVSKVFLFTAATGMTKTLFFAKKDFPDVVLPIKPHLQMFAALAHTLMGIPLILVALKLWVWLPVFASFIGTLGSVLLYKLTRARAAPPVAPEGVPAEGLGKYTDLLVHANLAQYTWQPGMILGLIACWLAWSL